MKQDQSISYVSFLLRPQVDEELECYLVRVCGLKCGVALNRSHKGLFIYFETNHHLSKTKQTLQEVAGCVLFLLGMEVTCLGWWHINTKGVKSIKRTGGFLNFGSPLRLNLFSWLPPQSFHSPAVLNCPPTAHPKTRSIRKTLGLLFLCPRGSVFF